MRRQAFIGIVLVALSHLAFANVTSALAQAGGIGGIIGKQDKSVSGDNAPKKSDASTKKQKSHHSIAKQQNEESGNAKGASCGKIVGRWKWGPGYLVVVKRDGTAQHAGGGSGTWTCNDGHYVFVWSIGITDHISLSADGKSVDGANSFGTFSGARF